MILAASIYGFAPAQLRRWCTHETTPLSDLEARLKNGSCEDDDPQDAKRADARRAPSGGKTGSKVLTGDDLKKQPLGCAVWGMV